jgi:hypothetical protein
VDTIKFHANHICYDCWKIFKRNENIAISDILGLPKLCGSRKQYVAGIHIRAEFAIQLIDNGFDEQNIKCFLQQQKEAGWWSGNKHKLSTLFDLQASVKDTKPEKEGMKYCVVTLLNIVLYQHQL